MKDCDGIELVVGDYLAYGARAGNSSKLRLGRVTQVEEKRVRVKWDKSTDGVRGESWISVLGCIFKVDGWPESQKPEEGA